MNCLPFERLLDGGEPWWLPEDAVAHARECARCARSLARARSLERALERHFASHLDDDTGAVLAGFTDRVMARVERGEARGVRWLALPDALPWWVRAAAEPGVLLASAVAALVLWRPQALASALRAGLPLAAEVPSRLAALAHASRFDSFGRALSQALAPVTQAQWAVTTGVALGLLPVFALMALALWRMGERIVGTVDGPRTS